MKIHYLEIVSLNVDAVCDTYEAAHNVSFGEADELLGGQEHAFYLMVALWE